MSNGNYVLFDDISIKDVSEKFREFNEQGLKSDIIITDVYACDDRIRACAEEELNRIGFDVEWVFFENNYEKCRKNIERRIESGDTRKVYGLLDALSKCYCVPDGHEIASVYEQI